MYGIAKRLTWTAGIVAAALATSRVGANLIEVNWTGTVLDGNAIANVFCVPISVGFHDLTGFTFTASYRFDTTLGSLVTGTGSADLRGGSQFGAGTFASPVVSA